MKKWVFTTIDHIVDKHFQLLIQVDSPKAIHAGVNQESFRANPARPLTEWIALSQIDKDDRFLVKGIGKFQKDKKRRDYFQFNRERSRLFIAPEIEQQDATDVSGAEDTGVMGGLKTLLPWNQPGRYLWALRIDERCEVCHSERNVPEGDLVKAEESGTSVPGDKNADSVQESHRVKPPIFMQEELVGAVSVVLPAGQTSVTLLFNRIFIVVGGLLSCICIFISI